MESEKFGAWLRRYSGLTDKSAYDVVSRLRRASKLVNVDSKQSVEDLLHKLGKQPEFKELTMTVRSQIRRAIRLYRTFEARHD